MALSKIPVKGKKFDSTALVGIMGALAYGYDGTTLVIRLLNCAGRVSP
jgi:hypothetical protein